MTDASVPSPANAHARQLAAIDESGWGERFRLFQPRNAMFWLFAWALVTGVFHSLDFYRQDVANYGGVLVGGGIAFAIYCAVWLAFLGATNRYTPESPKLLATGFGWGAIVATGTLALSANDALLPLYAKWFGQSWASDWAAGFTAPITEEFAKSLGLLVLFGLAPRLIRSAYDAFVVGAFIGLGFQIWENVLYVYQGAQADFGANQAATAFQVIVVRSISGVASHALFSAVFCTGLFWVLGWGAERRHVAKGLGLMFLAMIGHFTWDDAGALGAKIFGADVGAGPLMPLLIILDIALVLWVARLASDNEHTWMHDLLAPEIDRGTLTADEVAALANSRRKQRKYVKTLHGHHDRTTARHVLQAAHDLAEQIARDHGDETPEVAHARAEIERVRSL